MLRLLWKIIALILLAGFLAPINQVLAQEPIISGVTSQYEFGQWVEIRAQINHDLPQSILVFLQPENQTSRQLEIVPETDGNFTVHYNLNQDPLNPFSRVYYWFRLEYSDGSIGTTPSYWFDYVDNRYEWDSLSSKLFEVFWVEEDSDFGQKVIGLSTKGLEKATGLLALAPQLPIRIFIYPDSNSLQDALTLTHQPWVAGHAAPELGVILVSNDAGKDQLFELERQIPHELMHILIYQATKENSLKVPVWLSEGLATYTETYPNPELERAIADAVAADTLIPLESLCQTFPRDAQASQLAYAESLSMVKYLELNYGKTILVQMLDATDEGLSCTQLVNKVTGISLKQLEDEWIRSLTPAKPVPQGITILLSVIGAALLTGMVLHLIGRKKGHKNSASEKIDG